MNIIEANLRVFLFRVNNIDDDSVSGLKPGWCNSIDFSQANSLGSVLKKTSREFVLLLNSPRVRPQNNRNGIIQQPFLGEQVTCDFPGELVTLGHLLNILSD